MDTLPSDLTWNEVLNRFDEDKEYSLLLHQHRRRASKAKRAEGQQEKRFVWRLIIQRARYRQTKTLLRKNLRNPDDDSLLSRTADLKIIELINQFFVKPS